LEFGFVSGLASKEEKEVGAPGLVFHSTHDPVYSEGVPLGVVWILPSLVFVSLLRTVAKNITFAISLAEFAFIFKVPFGQIRSA
jgi:hypothetical protein